jgi:hydrogenase-4 membrane subunit HyfE
MLEYRGLLASLIRSREFWLCGLAVIPSVLFLLIPDFPASLGIALDVLFIVLLTTILHDVGRRGGRTAG